MPTVQVQGRAAHFHDGGVPWQQGRPAVAMIHGAGGDHTIWQQQSRALAHHGFNVAVVDLPGHGRSADVPELDSVEALAEWLSAVLDAAKLGPAALVGHSLGAAIAVELAARHPQQVTALALVGTGMPIRVGDQLLHDTQEAQPQAVNFITAYAHGKPSQIGWAPTPGNWMMGSTSALMLACTPEVLHRDFAVCHAWEGAESAAKVRCPTLVVAAANDRMTPPRTGKALAEAIPGATYEVMPGVGHMIQVEAPRPLLKRLRAFLADAA